MLVSSLPGIMMLIHARSTGLLEDVDNDLQERLEHQVLYLEEVLTLTRRTKPTQKIRYEVSEYGYRHVT